MPVHSLKPKPTPSPGPGELLRANLKKRGLSVTALANLSRVPRTAIHGILSGDLVPGPKMWSQILEVLELEPEEEWRFLEEAARHSEQIQWIFRVTCRSFSLHFAPSEMAEFVLPHFGLHSGHVTKLKSIPVGSEPSYGLHVLLTDRTVVGVGILGLQVVAARSAGEGGDSLPPFDVEAIREAEGVVFELKPTTGTGG